jgi:hypothetical protein
VETVALTPAFGQLIAACLACGTHKRGDGECPPPRQPRLPTPSPDYFEPVVSRPKPALRRVGKAAEEGFKGSLAAVRNTVTGEEIASNRRSRRTETEAQRKARQRETDWWVDGAYAKTRFRDAEGKAEYEQWKRERAEFRRRMNEAPPEHRAAYKELWQDWYAEWPGQWRGGFALDELIADKAPPELRVWRDASGQIVRTERLSPPDEPTIVVTREEYEAERKRVRALLDERKMNED